MHMPTTPNMLFAHYGQRTSGMLGDLVTYASWAIVAACAAEGYYIFQHGKDLLAGFGLVHNHHDAISLLKFYGVTGIIAFSLATHKYLKVTAAGLAIATLAGMYGTQFHLKAERTFDTASLPKVTSASLRDKVSANTSADTTVIPSTLDPDAMSIWAVDNGYTRDYALDQEKKDWCKAINPATGKPNLNNDTHAVVNCVTGYRWEAGK